MPPYPKHVTVVEVGPRDGLQNEAATLSTADKVRFIDLLSAAGLPVIEVAAFVSPRWVPQMADASEVVEGITRRAGTRYTALVPNLAGLEQAQAAGINEVAIFAAASESFSRRNINRGLEDSLRDYAEVCIAAQRLGMRIRGYLSTAFGCPFEGAVPTSQVADLAGRLIDMGVFEVAVSDTIGIAHPRQVVEVVEAVSARVPLKQIALHFHDTRGTALANVLTALQLGITTFDASAGGLGGCPYAPGATGNLATEDLLYLLHGLKMDTGVALEGVLAASRFIEPYVGHRLPSRYLAAANATHEKAN